MKIKICVGVLQSITPDLFSLRGVCVKEKKKVLNLVLYKKRRLSKHT